MRYSRPALRPPIRVALATAVGLLFAASARADVLADVRTRGELVWCADQEGGGPYVFPRDDNPEQVTGFEVDLAARVAAYLGVQPRFAQGPWDKLADMVRTGKCDVVLNGYEYTPERLDVLEATVPYYVYGLQLLTRKGDPLFRSWDDLGTPHDGVMPRVGVLTGSSAETTMVDFCGDTRCEVISYDGNTDAMREVETGKLDGTLQDTPIASFYLPSFPALTPTGAPVGHGWYVMYVAHGETGLRDALNEAIILSIRNGDLESIDKAYGIWDDAQLGLTAIADAGRFYGFHRAADVAVVAHETPAENVVRGDARKHGWEIVTTYGPVLVRSAGLTVVLACASFPIAMLVGLLVAIGRLYGPAWARWPLAAYVEFLRGTPLMLQLYFLFFLLPEVGIAIPAFWTGILGLAVNYSAYESEIYRAGLQAVPAGQLEAALSLGMSRAQAVRRILVPQAVRLVIPPVVNDFIALFKDTSVVSVVTLVELTKRFSVLSMSTQATVELMVMTALLYLLMSYPMAVLSRRVERSLGVGIA